MSDEPKPPTNEPTAPAPASRGFWFWFERLGPLVMLLAVVVGFSIASWEHFVSLGNARLILVQTAILATCSVGMTMILISGGLDLSVGSALALCAVVGAATYTATGSPTMVALACVATGAVVGAGNGILVAGFRMNPFIVTLGMMGAARGLARMVADDSYIYLYYPAEGDDRTRWVPKLLEQIPSDGIWASIGIAPGVFIMAGLVLVAAVMMRRSIFGRHIYAIGSNEESAQLCGVRVGWTKFAIYALAGAIFGIAGLMQLGYDNAGNPTARSGFELDVIAAVVIGGASLSGGTGTIIGSLVGAFIMVVLRNGFAIVGVSSATQQLVIGLIIVAATALDMVRQGTFRLPWMRG